MGHVASKSFAIVANRKDTGSMKISLRLSIILLLSLVWSFRVLAQGRADIFVATIEGIKHSVIPVLCGQFDLTGQFSIQLIDGTGFFVNADGDFVTAGHVIADLKTTSLQRPTPCVMAIYVPRDGWQREAVKFDVKWFVFGDCKTDSTLDLAVCRPVQKLPFTINPVVLEDSRPQDGSPVAFTGFPLGSVEPLSSRCNIAAYRGAADSEGSREFVLDKGTWPGASGSPIYDDHGAVIGIMLARGLADSVGTSFGRPSHFIVKFLRDNGISLTTSEDRPKKRKKK
jgi:S1-C subfamily serine protease